MQDCQPIACPIPPCDCAPGTPKGTIADVANYLGVNQIWSAGKRGEGIVVGVVDGGITATGRPLAAGEAPYADHRQRDWRVAHGYLGHAG